MSFLPPDAVESYDPNTSEQRFQRLDQNILYAQKLQDALFRNCDIDDLFQDNFIIDQPKDLVGGDFYLIDEIAGKKMVLVGDCTGHGPSGAMLSALCVSILKELIARYKTLSPAMVITKALLKLEDMLKNGEQLIKDSMELTLIFINESKREIKYASTGQYIFLNGPSTEKVIKSRNLSLESSQIESLTDQTLTYTSGAMIYLPTDGMKDQFGSDTGRRFSSRKMSQIFSEHWQKSCSEQKNEILKEFNFWQGTEEDQTDDVLLIGLRL